MTRIVPSSQRSTAYDSLESTLRQKLASALAATDNLGPALAALSVLDPQTAAAWLVEHRALIRAQIDTAELPRLLEAVVRSSDSFVESLDRKLLSHLIESYGEMLDPPILLTLAEALPSEAREQVLGESIRGALRRYPTHEGLLRQASEFALQKMDGVSAHPLLTRLAHADSSQATVAWVRRARLRLPQQEAPEIRAALLSSFTIDPLIPYLDLECRELGLTPELYVAPFNTWAQEVMGPTTPLGAFAPEIVFFSLSIDDLVPALAGPLDSERLQADGAAALERVLDAIRRFRGWSDSPIVVHSLYSSFRDPVGPVSRQSRESRSALLAQLNARLGEALTALPHAYLLDMNELLLWRKGGEIENVKLRHLASFRLSEQVLPAVARAYAGYIAPLKGLTRKCVVLDLDNTLWGGVVGEDGPHGIKLGASSPGSEYQEFQRYLLSLTERGFLLAIASKNNPEDALEVLRTHEGMVLREPAFSALKINWRPKPENLLSMAEELGIGVDSMVFVDDNPDERELMRQMLPQVLTPEMPRDPALFRATLETLPQLQSLFVTEEDRTRVDQYRAKRERESARTGAASVEDYLHSLGIVVEIEPVSEKTIPRVHQLFQRTNQFNLTTRRHDAPQLAQFASNPVWRLYSARTRDRFGDHGLVATALVRIEGGRWIIDSFLMSCRVIGYGVETALLARIWTAATEAGAVEVVGEFIETKKNVPARDFYARHGFASGTPEGEVVRWSRSLADGPLLSPAWIQAGNHDA